MSELKINAARFIKTRVFLFSLLAACVWVIGFKFSAPWLQSVHLPLFGGVFLLVIFVTIYRATRQLNHYLAGVISEHKIIRWLIEARLSSFILALLFSGVLTVSAMVFVFNLDYQAWWIVFSGFAWVSLLMLSLTFRDYVRAPIYNFSRAYISVLFGALWMLAAQLTVVMLWPIHQFEPMTIELLEQVRANVNHGEVWFQHIARTALYIELNILALAQVDGFSPWLVATILLLTTSIVPFMALALFARSIYEGFARWILPGIKENGA